MDAKEKFVERLNMLPRMFDEWGVWFAWFPVRTTAGHWRWFKTLYWFRYLHLDCVEPKRSGFRTVYSDLPFFQGDDQ